MRNIGSDPTLTETEKDITNHMSGAKYKRLQKIKQKAYKDKQDNRRI